jgi:hypothetical protein
MEAGAGLVILLDVASAPTVRRANNSAEASLGVHDQHSRAPGAPTGWRLRRLPSAGRPARPDAANCGRLPEIPRSNFQAINV